MEVWKEKEEVAESGLRGRPPRQHGQTTTNITPSEGVEAYIDGKSGIFFANDGGNEPVDEFSGSKDNGNTVDTTISETASLLQSSIISFEQQISHAISSNNGTTTDVIREIREDETELDLDQIFKKPIAHEFVCPNCNYCIKKVLVRERHTDPECIDFFRCSSCFSFLIPAGNWFRSHIMKQPESTNIEQETNLVQGPPMEREPLLGTIHGKTKPQPRSSSMDDKHLQTTEANEGPKSQGETKNGNTSIVLNVEEDIQNFPSEPRNDKKWKMIKSTECGGLIEPITRQNSHYEPRNDKKWEIIKSIVYGGLTESITSLSVVTSAASADATTLNIIALALANLVGGLFMIGHNLRELKNEQPRDTADQTNEQMDKYQELLGKRENFILHAIVSILSFLIFGLVPPLVYGFSFQESDDKYYKLAAVAAASLLCITILAISKAYVRNPPKNYIKTVSYYVVAGFMASGVSYLAGELIKKLIEKFGWFSSNVAVTMPFADKNSERLEWASY